MHNRQSKQAWILIRTRAPSRTSATATKVADGSSWESRTLLSQHAAKWVSPEPLQSQSSPGSDRQRWGEREADSGAKRRQKQPATAILQPDLSKWARPLEPFALLQQHSPLSQRPSDRYVPDSRTDSTSRPAAPHFSRWAYGYSRSPVGSLMQQDVNTPRGDATVPKRKLDSRLDRPPPHRDEVGNARLDRGTLIPPQTRINSNNHRNGSGNIKNKNRNLAPAEAGEFSNFPKIPSEFIEDDLRRSGVSRRVNAREQFRRPRFADLPFQSTDSARSQHGRSVVQERKRKDRFLMPVNTDVYLPSVCSVQNLAQLLNVRIDRLQRVMEQAGMSEQTSYDHLLSHEDATLLAMEFNRNPVVDDEAAFDIYAAPAHPDPMSLPQRPPVVTIMGHVDHGKTTLLDTLRSSSVAKGEAGGITQHIGAFSVAVPSASDAPSSLRTITFLDTPGHAAFSAMRARGVQVTDIIVLVVAADDGVKPQTKEVIDLIQRDAGEVGVVVAINKVDKPGVNVERVHTDLWTAGLQLESMDGEIPAVEVSGLTGEGLDTLVETISALAEVQDIRAQQDGQVHGFILESKITKGHGPSATVLVLRGTLTPSTPVITGQTYAKVRQITDSSGKPIKYALPGMAVTVTGWKELPQAGDEVLSGTEVDVKKAAQNRVRKAQLTAALADAEAINAARRAERERREAQERVLQPSNAGVVNLPLVIQPSGPKELRLVVKGDVSGSVEAVAEALKPIGNQHAVVKVVSTGVGDVNESDVMMAKATGAMIAAFSVNVPKAAKTCAAQNGVSLYQSAIIYEIMDEVKERIIPLLPVIVEKKVTGEASVLQLFEIQLKGNKNTLKVAGCRVTNGVVEKNRPARVVRGGETIHEGVFNVSPYFRDVATLRLFKKDVNEVKKGAECGMSFEKFDDLREGDLIQLIQVIEKPGKL